MATWAIGDVHGCFRTLRKLLKRVAFDPAADRLWLTGDLVNRGPGSLETLEWARDLDERLTVVLGNHDLHLLAVAAGVAEERARDTLRDVLRAKRCDDLLGWLLRRPLAVRQGRHLLVHAGLLPEWSAADCERVARAVEDRLTGGEGPELLAAYRARREAAGSFELAALTALTLLRTLRADGSLCREFSGPPDEAPDGCVPWYDAPGRRSGETTVVCGHWAALGLRLRPDLFALDSGCAWGGRLSAVCLEDGRVEQVANSE
jgi:bis(5'-nucleosyl)-tetraphosphatase (symmetrical)